MARILIAGCGDVGGALGVLLRADGHQVFGLRRNVAALPDGIEPVAGDLADADSLRSSLPGNVDLLAYTAAASGFDDAAYERAYVTGLHNLMDTLDRSRLSRVLFVSSTAVYAQTDGGWVDETSATEPAGFSGRRLLEGEAAAVAFGVRTVSVRFGGIYGPGRTRLLDTVRGGATCCEDPVTWTNRIHRDDCAGVLRHLLVADQPESVYVGVDCEPAPRCAVLDWLAERLGAPRPVRVAASGRSRGGNKRCSSARLRDSGYRFLYPTFREGYAQVLGDALEPPSSR